MDHCLAPVLGTVARRVSNVRFGSAIRHSPAWTWATSAETSSASGRWLPTPSTSARHAVNVRSVSAAAKSVGNQRPLALERSEEHTSELQSRQYLVCRLLLEKKKT